MLKVTHSISFRIQRKQHHPIFHLSHYHRPHPRRHQSGFSPPDETRAKLPRLVLRKLSRFLGCPHRRGRNAGLRSAAALAAFRPSQPPRHADAARYHRQLPAGKAWQAASARFIRRCEAVVTPRESVLPPRETVVTGRKSVQTPRKSVHPSREPLYTPRESAKTPRKSLSTPRKSVYTGCADQNTMFQPNTMF